MGYISSEDPIFVGPLVGAGNERIVYLHPEHDERVIKIDKKIEITRNRIDDAYLSLLGPQPMLPSMYGWVETERGRGLVFERIRDANGETSETLGAALQAGRISVEEARLLLKAVLAEIVRKGIILHDDDNINNFVVQRFGSGSRLVMVDGFGPFVMTTKARLRMRFPWLAREKTLRCAFNLMAAFERDVRALASKQILEDV